MVHCRGRSIVVAPTWPMLPSAVHPDGITSSGTGICSQHDPIQQVPRTMFGSLVCPTSIIHVYMFVVHTVSTSVRYVPSSSELCDSILVYSYQQKGRNTHTHWNSDNWGFIVVNTQDTLGDVCGFVYNKRILSTFWVSFDMFFTFLSNQGLLYHTIHMPRQLWEPGLACFLSTHHLNGFGNGSIRNHWDHHHQSWCFL